MNRSIIALCLWLTLFLVAVVYSTGWEEVCIGAQSIDNQGGTIVSDVTCQWVRP